MQHNKYRGRLTVILVVLFLGVMGIFWPPGRLFDLSTPWRKKLNLRPGIDIKGGISLLYEIKASPNNTTENLAERVAESLKKRVDPQGVRNLVWRPQGATRLEIQMPLGDNADEAKRSRENFAARQKELEATNVRLGEVRAALEIADIKEREKKLDSLAMGYPLRRELLNKLAVAYDKWQALKSKSDEASKLAAVDAEDQKEAIEKQLEETNLSLRQVQNNVLDLYQGLIEKARGKAAADGKLKDRDEKIAAIRVAAKDFPQRVKAIDALVSSFDSFAKVRSSVDDAEELKRLLRGSGVLEFRILWDPTSATTDENAAADGMIKRLQAEGPLPRAGDTMRWYEVDQPEQLHSRPMREWGGKNWSLAFITPGESMVHKEGQKPWGLESASKGFDSRSNEPCVNFALDPQGAVLFGDLSGTHIGKPLAILLDDKVISAPNLLSRIDGNGQITGKYSDADLQYLIRTLNAGSLPARLADEPISERIVSPTLGADNLSAGFTACMVGLVVVAIFLLGYYYLSGGVAMVAVLMNMIIIVGVLALFGATFTLPGIAGMVLTLGSAVDANVLIFERLREEEARGLSLRMALRNAYDRAWSAILDSNMITIITSAILYWFGSEEVKGFGLTLLIGIASSLFTSLFVTRTVFDYILERYEIKKLGSLPLTYPAWDRLLKPNIDWMSKVWWFVAMSVVITVAGISAFVTEGRKMYDIEFVSGTSVQFELKEPATRAEVMTWLTSKPEFEKPLPAVQVVAVGSNTKEREYEVVTPNEKSQEVRDTLMKALQGKLNIDVPSKFDAVDALFDPAKADKVFRPANDEAVNAYPWAKLAIQSHRGGMVIALNHLDPPLTAAQITDRIERTRLQPDRANMPYRKIDVEVPTDPAKPATSAIILVSDENLAFEKDEGKWSEELARPMWKLVTEAINKPAVLQKVSNFNAQVAHSTMWDAIKALTISIVLVMIYVWLRFGNFKFGSATVVAMLHDVFIVVGAIGLSHYLSLTWFGRHVLLLEPFRINLTMVAAILTVMGYSMMDTIVVFDRIRENRGKFGFISRQVINDSINQTLSRTLLTAGTTIVTVGVMYFVGGPGLHGFTFALLVGILVGTYSSIAIAAPILLLGDNKVAGPGDRGKMPLGQLQRVGQ